MTEPTSAEKNEAIARWMGWSHTSGSCPTCEAIPAYDESLDALVPVMEALRRSDSIDVGFEEVGPHWMARIGIHMGDHYAEGETMVEALRDAIYAALVAMEEIEDPRMQCDCEPYKEQGACVHTVM